MPDLIIVTWRTPLPESACNPAPTAENPHPTAAAGPEGYSCSAVHIEVRLFSVDGWK